jgi:integrase
MPLTDIAAKTAKPRDKQYRLPDGGGLCLLVHPNGSKYWQLRYRYKGKATLLGLGIYPEVKLTAAREKAREAKSQLAAGKNPSEEKKLLKMVRNISQANTFEAVAAEWYEVKSQDWSETHKARTLNILKSNLGRWIGHRPISEINSPELLAAIRHTEKKGNLETAKRCLQVAGQVFRYAVATGRADKVPSENLKGALATPKVKHFSAITEPAELGKLLVAIDGYSGSSVVKAAMQLSALLFQRPGEIRHMEWKALDLQKGEWRYIATKTQSPHIVPLARQAVAILLELQPFTGRGRYVFPSGRAGGRPLSENAVRAGLRTLGYTNDQHTPHGFRATARTILDEVLGYRVDWIEHQLAHAVRDANGTAYNRTAHLEGRKEMMQGWADYLDSLKANVGLPAEEQTVAIKNASFVKETPRTTDPRKPQDSERQDKHEKLHQRPSLDADSAPEPKRRNLKKEIAATLKNKTSNVFRGDWSDTED